MTDLESPKKNNDCYFYYYSTCAKGDSCMFRHEASALGCETVCNAWKEGKCFNTHCNLRHMELRKNRRAIPCYWESQPGGCLKEFCPFLHEHPRQANVCTKSTESSVNIDKPERKVTAVDSLVVNIEEESDSEFGPTPYSPLKTTNRIVKVKTLEEIKLEKIQAESAAFYSYQDQSDDPILFENTTDMRDRIVKRIVSKPVPERRVILPTVQRRVFAERRKRLSDDQLASILGDESLRKYPRLTFQEGGRRVIENRKPLEQRLYPIDQAHSSVRNFKRVIKNNKNEEQQKEVQNIKIKTLQEIRAERESRLDKARVDKEEAEVTSTSNESSSVEERMVGEEYANSVPASTSSNANVRRLKLRRKLQVSDTIMSSSTDSQQSVLNDEKTDITSFGSSHPHKTMDVQQSDDKILDDVLLLEEDDDDYDITLKAEEDLLNDDDL